MTVKTLSQSQVASVSGAAPMRYIGDLIVGYIFGMAIDGARSLVGNSYTPGYTNAMGDYAGDGN